MRQINKWKTRLKLFKISSVALVTSAIISVSVVLLTIYGQNVGNFVITVEEDNRVKLSLSETPEFENPTSVLTAEGLKDMTNTSRNRLPKNYFGTINGAHNDNINHLYSAYTFYLRNYSDITVDFLTEIVIKEEYKDVSSATWFMLITEFNGNITTKFYAKARPDGSRETGGGKYTDLNQFASPSVVLSEEYLGLKVGDIIKFTIVYWLDGDDPECVDKIKGGSMRMEMQFKPLL